MVDNAGPTPDPGPVTVTDPLPAGETYVGASGPGWTCNHSGQDVTCTRPGAYPVGQRSTIALTVLLGAAAVPTVTNTATVAGTGTDPVPANNSSSDPATVGPGVDLSVTKTLIGTGLVTGSDASYLVTVHNAGPSPATGVTITDSLPAGLTPIGASGTGWTCTVAGNTIHCAYGPDLPSGASTTITVVSPGRRHLRHHHQRGQRPKRHRRTRPVQQRRLVRPRGRRATPSGAALRWVRRRSPSPAPRPNAPPYGRGVLILAGTLLTITTRRRRQTRHSDRRAP